MTDMSAIVKEFVAEGNEKADQLEHLLIRLEKNPAAPELIAQIFRALHSIKGATSFLGFTKLCALAHDGEKLLVRFRDGAMVATPEHISALLSLVDTIRSILGEIAATGHEGNNNYTSLSAALTGLQKVK